MKDPAFLFYSSDFLTGTMTMSNEEVGMYIRLLCLQHQKGHLTEKDMNNICKSYVKDVYDKFTKNDGLYFNERLFQETEKRSKYAQSRRLNRLGKTNKKEITYDTTYVPHMENENILLYINICTADEAYTDVICMQNKISKADIKKWFDTFQIHIVSTGEKYNNISEFKKHFSYWLKKQNKNPNNRPMVY